MQAGKDPRQRARHEYVTDELTLRRAQHAHVVDQHLARVADALVRAEEHHEEHERDRERDLRPDAEAEPEQKQRREHDARDGVQHFDVGIEHRRGRRRSRQREPERDAERGAGGQAEQRFFERHDQMRPERAARDPCPDAANDIGRPADEERIEHLQRDEPLPQRERGEADEDLPDEYGRSRHADS